MKKKKEYYQIAIPQTAILTESLLNWINEYKETFTLPNGKVDERRFPRDEQLRVFDLVKCIESKAIDDFKQMQKVLAKEMRRRKKHATPSPSSTSEEKK